MTLPVRFVNHACVAISPLPDGEILLTDPWFSGEVFNRSWNLLVDGDWALVDWARVRHIWISHEHPDHLNFPTLKEIRSRVTGPLKVYYRAQRNKNVRDALAKMGFEVIELEPEAEVRINARIAITTYWRGQDTAAVFRVGADGDEGGMVIVNQNDCQLKPAVAKRIARRFGKIDLLLFQFSLAGYYANADDAQGLNRARQSHLAMIARYIDILQPRVYVPFASFVYFCKTANRFLNEWAVRLDDVVALPSLAGRVQVCTPGDAVLSDSPRDVAALAPRIDYWRALFDQERPYHAPRRVEPSELAAAGQQFAADVAAVAPRWVRTLCLGKTAYRIEDMAQYLILDYADAACTLAAETGDARLAGSLPAEEALFFLKFPWGADTLNITSAFHVTDKPVWKRSLYLKHLLYVVRTSWARRLIVPAAWLAAIVKK